MVLTVGLVADDATLDRRSLVLPVALAALGLWALASVAWSPAVAWPVLEAERLLLYATAAGALVLVVRPGRVEALLAGIVSGSAAVGLYALSTRLFPGRIGGAYDPSAGYQLAEPIGYSNTLGMTLVIGLLVGVGLALRGGRMLRASAGGVLVPLTVALYFTFSRGALVALAAGLLILLVLERRALVGVPVLALAPATGVLLASRAPALPRAGEPLGAAQEQGARLAWQIVVLGLVGAAAAAGLHRVAAHRRPDAVRVRRLSLPAAAAVAAAVVVVLAREGGPVAVVDTAVAAFREESPTSSLDLGGRLLSVSGHGRADYWRVASGMAGREPLLGEGAGSFERHWLEERPAPHGARDAHNLYLETLAELGPLGLGLLLVALGAPLTGLPRARRARLVPAAAAAYAAFLVHAGVDWDWEVPLVVLPALACAAVLVAEARPAPPTGLTATRRAALACAAAAAVATGLVAHVGNGAIARSAAALERGDTEAAAASARRA
ncbi:MAG TPA: O-antigen ligase family protein, partial [Gaiellaceae bacterium]|nr:O-antigen ligase family protein [Gaiellaceae bacterium]